ncbi:MAG: hypothetical protein FJ206_08550 [Gemmatimonadetes bacterium]|nr:hypothetical protein [Gemmatimonadota bacterium]
MAWPVRFYASTIGRKVVMALTGALLVGFLLVHMGGNLLIHRGPAAINDYAVFLKSNLAVLWGVRSLPLACCRAPHSRRDVPEPPGRGGSSGALRQANQAGG